MNYVSKDRAALAALNEAAHNARRMLGHTHPDFAQILRIMRETDELVDKNAPIYPAEGMSPWRK